MKNNHLALRRAARLLLALGCVALVPSESYGATIVGSTGFEGPPDFSTGYTYTYNGDYAGYGNGGANQDLQDTVVDSVGAYDPVNGTGGSGAFTFDYDATRVPQPGAGYPTAADPPVQYSYWGTFQGFGFAIQNPLTSASLGDYVLSVDARVSGFIFGVISTPMTYNVKFEVPDDTLGPDPDTNLDVLIEVFFDLAEVNTFSVTSSFANFSRSVGDYNRIFEGSLANFEMYYSLVSNININFGLNEGARDFGLDAGNQLIIDNALLEQVPEPGVFVLLGAAFPFAFRRVAAQRFAASVINKIRRQSLQ